MYDCTVTVSGNRVCFWKDAEGGDIRSPVIERLILEPTFQRAVMDYTRDWREGLADDLKKEVKAVKKAAEAQVSSYSLDLSVLKRKRRWSLLRE